MSILYLEKDGRSFHQRVVCCVFFSSWFGTEPRIPLVKHITQMCHKRGWAWTVQKASVSPLEHSLTRRWHASLLLFWGCHGGVQLLIFFFWCYDSSEAAPGASSSPLTNCRQDLGIQGGRYRNVKTKDNETHLGRVLKVRLDILSLQQRDLKMPLYTLILLFSVSIPPVKRRSKSFQNMQEQKTILRHLHCVVGADKVWLRVLSASSITWGTITDTTGRFWLCDILWC